MQATTLKNWLKKNLGKKYAQWFEENAIDENNEYKESFKENGVHYNFLQYALSQIDKDVDQDVVENLMNYIDERLPTHKNSVFAELGDYYLEEYKKYKERPSKKNKKDAFVDFVNKHELSKTIAMALDMNFADYLDIILKISSVSHSILNQDIKITVKTEDGEFNKTTLIKKDGDTLKYKDILGSRSGPLFGGMLDLGRGQEYLHCNYSDREVQLKKETIKNHLDDYRDFIPPHILNSVRKYFEQPINVSRKISDVDLVVSNLQPLQDSIEILLRDYNIDNIETNSLRTIAEKVWKNSSCLDINSIKSFLYFDKQNHNHPNYKKNLQLNKLRQKSFFSKTTRQSRQGIESLESILNKCWSKGLGFLGFPQELKRQRNEHIIPIGISFEALNMQFDSNGKIVYGRNKKIKFNDKEPGVEHGDVIMDTTSLFMSDITNEKNFEIFTKEVAKLLGAGITESIKQKLTNFSYKNINNLKEEVETLLNNDEASEAFKKICENYDRNARFIYNSPLFEEIGKKEGQTQQFIKEGNTKKIIGNISDITPFVAGLNNYLRLETVTDEDKKNARAHLDQTKISLLISLTRWGFSTKSDIMGMEIGEKWKKVINSNKYKESINKRSYGISDSDIRSNIKWHNIDDEEAKNRLINYENNMQPVWDFITGKSENSNKKSNTIENSFVGKYLLATSNYAKALEGGKKVTLIPCEAAIKQSIEQIFNNECQDLRDKMIEFNGNNKDISNFYEQLTSQVTSAIKLFKMNGANIQHDNENTEEVPSSAVVIRQVSNSNETSQAISQIH